MQEAIEPGARVRVTFEATYDRPRTGNGRTGHVVCIGGPSSDFGPWAVPGCAEIEVLEPVEPPARTVIHWHRPDEERPLVLERMPGSRRYGWCAVGDAAITYSWQDLVHDGQVEVLWTPPEVTP